MLTNLCLDILLNRIAKKHTKLRLLPSKDSELLQDEINTINLKLNIKIYQHDLKQDLSKETINEDTLDKINYLTNATIDVITNLLHFLEADTKVINMDKSFPKNEFMFNDFVNFIEHNTALTTFLNKLINNKYGLQIVIVYQELYNKQSSLLWFGRIKRIEDGSIIIEFYAKTNK